ncbi:BAG family molecular chaperone regulator 2 [Amphibalanus amphitrite]|uniref:BAG family molecular chaperone regulator 2 n=1 Tax=Amphibalanus amphitrite TaxID=1232801 RepID=A0A6A4VW86_AMPAM|nr:uncharacterized protein LOC122372499 [Amphibalanus amphitrite]XP_043205653.1 uncharacterized protein LOC122372499 [Amphibalanus amphitrite]KAF0294158.1 BAG family molecular chaperone regulator 2 [Amphibalanus amphitrite]
MEPEEASAVSGDPRSVSGQLKQMMELVEHQVDALVEDTRRIQAERDNLIGTLLILQNDENVQGLEPRDKETVSATCESLVQKCLGVEINIDPAREPDQEVALHMVNNWIDQLVLTARQDPAQARLKCETYVRTLNGDGLVDETFSSIVTGCATTDRETVGSRLSGLLNYIDYMMGRPSEME